MQVTLLPTGTLLVQNPAGSAYEIGAEHPEYQRLRAQSWQPATRSVSLGRLLGLAMIAVGIGGWWYNWHLAATQGEFYIKLCVLGPLGLFGGLLVLVRPEWAGPLRKDSPPAQKIALFAVLGLMAAASGIDMYRLMHRQSPRSSRTVVTPWTPAMGTPVLSSPASGNLALGIPAGKATPEITLLGQQYHLGSFNQRQNATWEFISAGDTIDDWKTLITIVDRPDAGMREQLDRLAEGIMSTYKSHGGQILAARTMRDNAGAAFNYMVAAFDEADKQRFELNFVKMALGPKNATVVIYGVRITDPRDYRSKAKVFLDQKSSEVGRALSEAVLPDIARLPRRVF